MPDVTDIAPEAPTIFPLVVAGVTLTAWDGFSYVDAAGRTYWSGAAEPSEADAADTLASPRTPPVPVPDVLSRAQFVIAARRLLGLTEGEIYALITTIPDQETRETARDLFENALTFRRQNALLNAVAALNGNTPEEVDEVFRHGAALDLDA